MQASACLPDATHNGHTQTSLKDLCWEGRRDPAAAFAKRKDVYVTVKDFGVAGPLRANHKNKHRRLASECESAPGCREGSG